MWTTYDQNQILIIYQIKNAYIYLKVSDHKILRLIIVNSTDFALLKLTPNLFKNPNKSVPQQQAFLSPQEKAYTIKTRIHKTTLSEKLPKKCIKTFKLKIKSNYVRGLIEVFQNTWVTTILVHYFSVSLPYFFYYCNQ